MAYVCRMSESAVHPNCVWLSFLEGWAEEARTRGAKSAAAFLKAHRSLAAHHDAFVHPCETVQLAGIGPSIADKLTREYGKWCEQNGLEMPEPRMSLVMLRVWANNSAASGSGRADATRRAVDASRAPPTEGQGARKRRRTKEYIPAPRSGAHGLLVGLYTKACERLGEEVYVGKTELISLSQPFCDSDYNVPGGGSAASAPRSLSQARAAPGRGMNTSVRSFATAWSGMKTLIDKGYVYRSGNPPVFTLSEQGFRVAQLLAEAEGVSLDYGDGDAAETLPSAPVTLASQAAPDEVTTEANRDPPEAQESHSNAFQDALYLPPRTQPHVRSPPPEARDQQDADEDLAVVVDLITSSEDDVFAVDGAPTVVRDSSPVMATPAPSAPTQAQTVSISLIDSSPIVGQSPAVERHAHSEIPSIQDGASVPRTQSTAWRPHRDCIVLPPDSYDVILVLDYREVRFRPRRPATGAVPPSSQPPRASFVEALEDRGVPCDQRALELGDVMWIARPKRSLASIESTSWPLVQEVALDVVVERKRLDDLTSSIFDGRWTEQKQRLRSAGVGQVLYLIEDVDVTNLVQRYGSQIQTALSSTEVIDGFFVHRTANNEGTADFLASLHQAVSEMYQGKELRVLRDESIARETYAEMQRELRAREPEHIYHTSFHTFQAMNGKSSTGITVQDIWTKMLLCIRGLSQEKASEIVTRWPTPRSFAQALHEYERSVHPSDEERQAEAGRHFVSSHVDPHAVLPRRKIGNVLSTRIRHILRAYEYFDHI